jgi:ABC-2 type transport system permease protein
MMSVASRVDGSVIHNGFTGVHHETWSHARTSGRHRLRQLGENSLRRLLPNTGVLTARILRRWGRDTATLVESLIMPIVLLVTLDIVLGDGVSQVTGHSALYGSVPLIAMVGAMTGAMVGGIGLMGERSAGFLSRLWVLPIHRASSLLSRLAAEVVRIVVTTAAVLCVGLLLGFRFRQGIVESVMWLLVPAVLGVAFSVAVITLALFAASTTMVELTEGVWALLMFFSTGFVPLDQFPRWVQPVVEHQPVSCAVEAMRGLALGGPVLTPLVQMLLWSVGIIAACAVPMAVRYRRASMRG